MPVRPRPEREVSAAEGTKCKRCEGDGWVETFNEAGFVNGSTCCPRCSGEGRQNDSWMASLTDPEVLRDR